MQLGGKGRHAEVAVGAVREPPHEVEAAVGGASTDLWVMEPDETAGVRSSNAACEHGGERARHRGRRLRNMSFVASAETRFVGCQEYRFRDDHHTRA